MNRCDQGRRLFGAYWDDEVTQAEREWLESHFAGCPTCRQQYEQFARTLEAVGLPALVKRLNEEAHWNRILSLGEQQRLAIARAILQKPDFLFLDEATASLDETSEAALYRLLEGKLPDTTIVSIGHRSTLTAFHQRNVVLVREGDRFALQNRGENVSVKS